MTWCFSTRASVATVLTRHPCISQCLKVKGLKRYTTAVHMLTTNWLQLGLTITKHVGIRCFGNGSFMWSISTWLQFYTLSLLQYISTLRPKVEDKNGWHFVDNVFKCTFLNENIRILINISLKFVPKGQINSTPGLVQIQAWRQPGDKPVSKPMMFSLLMYICATQPQWFEI